MNLHEYKRRLLDMERQLSARTDREREGARAPGAEPGDAGDESVRDESQSEQFAGVERDAAVLQQVRDALQRIGDGTFGHCVVDGAPIEEERLEAVPWTPFCRTHQQLREGAPSPGPTL